MIKSIGLVLAFTILNSGLALSQSRGASRAYYDKEFKVGFRYPANWDRVVTKNPVGDGTEIVVVVVSPPARTHRGQSFEGGVTISVSKGTVSEKACNEFTEPYGDGSRKPVKTRPGNMTFCKVAEAIVNQGTVEQNDTYDIFHEGKCYSVGLSVQRKNISKPDQNVRMVNDGLDRSCARSTLAMRSADIPCTSIT
ncbi:MAG TPA: hypothetical protein DC054_08125 [Blastocatellia bacterium]|nr:hypothetical protein [Blastocatellia bacterium]